MFNGKECFFCGELINGRKHREHIIPNSLLGVLGLKNKKIYLSSGKTKEYSRLKVDAHKECNNELGSRYEEKIIDVFKNLDKYQKELEQMHLSRDIIIGHSDKLNCIITTWFAKIFYGLFWYEIQLDDTSSDKKKAFRTIIDNLSFQQVRQSYANGSGFILPSSVFYIKLKCSGEVLFDFGSQTNGVMWWKMSEHFFVVCMADGQLTSEYFNDDVLQALKESETPSKHSLFYLTILSHIMATRAVMPKSPRFTSTDKQIMNMSFMTMSTLSYAMNMEEHQDILEHTHHNLLENHLKISRE